MTDTRERGKVDFQDVAKLATLPQASQGSTEEQKENSGIIHLSALAAREAPATEKAEVVPKSVSPPTPPAPRDVVRGAALPPELPSMVRSRAAATHAPAIVGPRWAVWVALAAGIALGALTAGLVIGRRAPSFAQETRTAATSPEQGVPVIAPAKTSGAPTHGSTSGDHKIESSALGAAEPPVASASPAAVPSSAPAAIASRKPVVMASATPPAATAPSATSSATSPTPSAVPSRSGTDESLEALMKRSIGGNDHPAAAGAPPSGAGSAETTSNGASGQPAKPALGAVQGALGTVMPAARYCLGPDDPVSRATITFRSDGSVQSVGVTGDAAGQPAEGCIRSRLMAARVPPFTSPTFTWTVTVRPAN
jgi:hypothetical protein